MQIIQTHSYTTFLLVSFAGMCWCMFSFWIEFLLPREMRLHDRQNERRRRRKNKQRYLITWERADWKHGRPHKSHHRKQPVLFHGWWRWWHSPKQSSALANFSQRMIAKITVNLFVISEVIIGMATSLYMYISSSWMEKQQIHYFVTGYNVNGESLFVCGGCRQARIDTRKANNHLEYIVVDRNN